MQHPDRPPTPPKSWSEETARGRLKLVLLAVLPAALLLTCGEVVARLSIHRHAETFEDPATGEQTYRLQIGRFPFRRDGVTPLNSLGFPDDEFERAVDHHACTHLVFSGDSFVFGDGVDREDNFVEVLARRVADERPDRCLRIFNIAERATTVEQQTEAIEETLPLLAPDLVILGQYQNDLTDLHRLRHERGLGQFAASKRVFQFALTRFLTYHAFAFMIQNGIHYDALSNWSILEQPQNRETAVQLMERYAAGFATLRERLGDEGVELGVVIFPSKFDVLAGRAPEESFFLELAERHGVPTLRLMPLFERQRRPYAFLLYDGHLNEHGNALVAAAVFDWLFEAEPAPFPRLRISDEQLDSARYRPAYKAR